MKFIALHKDGYLYRYIPTRKGDVKEWFKNLASNKIVKVFLEKESIAPNDLLACGMETSIDFVNGAMQLASVIARGEDVDDEDENYEDGDEDEERDCGSCPYKEDCPYAESIAMCPVP